MADVVAAEFVTMLSLLNLYSLHYYLRHDVRLS